MEPRRLGGSLVLGGLGLTILAGIAIAAGAPVTSTDAAGRITTGGAAVILLWSACGSLGRGSRMLGDGRPPFDRAALSKGLRYQGVGLIVFALTMVAAGGFAGSDVDILILPGIIATW